MVDCIQVVCEWLLCGYQELVDWLVVECGVCVCIVVVDVDYVVFVWVVVEIDV